jgi:methylase of polypeptide subunit release factors
MTPAAAAITERRLLARLTAALGHAPDARNELRWMKDALRAPRPPGAAHDLAAMVARRTAGEPLQYILGARALLARP